MNEIPITLRDLFAGFAMLAFQAHPEYGGDTRGQWMAETAKCAYEQADAMLAVREGGAA